MPGALGRAIKSAGAVFALACLCLSAPAAAMTAGEYFEDGNRLFRDDLYWAALLRYRQARESGLDTPLLHYNEGVAHYRAGQHIRARESLMRALESPTLRTTTQYNLGLNAWAAGQTDEALRWFRLARDQQQNGVIADYARVAIARIRAGEAKTDPVRVKEERRRQEQSFANLELSASVSFGNDDNVFRSPEDPYIDLADPAQPIVLPEPKSGAYMPYRLGAKYRVNAFRHEGFFGAYRIAGRYYQDKELDNANEFSHEFSFGSQYRRRDEESGRERRLYSAFKIAQHDEVYYDPDDGESRVVDNVALDDRLNYLRYGPELTLSQSGRRLGLGLRVKGQLWNYDKTGSSPEFDHEYFDFGLYGQYRFTSTSLLRVSAGKSSRRFGDRRARDLDGSIDIGNENLRYDYLELSVLARQRITDKLWFGVEYERRERTDQYLGYNDYIRDSYGGEISWDIGNRVELGLSGHYRLYDYQNAFAFDDPAGGQKTLETADGELEASFRMTRNLYLVLEASYRERVSNDFRLAYERMQYVLGVRWEQ